jgi:hypothetical protein
VSFVLNEAGQGGKMMKSKPAAEGPNDGHEQVKATVAQIEEQGEYTLAGLLEALAKRRTAEASPVKRPTKQGS